MADTGARSDMQEQGLVYAVGGCVAFIVALTMVVWAAEEASGFLAHGRRPGLGLAAVLLLMIHLPAHWQDPAAAFPPSARAAAPPALLFWTVLLVLLGVLTASGVAIARRATAHQHERGARLATPRQLRRGTRRGRRGRGLRPGPSIFLGWYGWPPLALAVRTNTGEHAGAIAPPGYGKTAGQHIGAVVAFEGAVVSATTKPDVLRATAGVRRRIAERHGGDVYVLDLSGAAFAETGTRLREARIDVLAGCEDPMVAEERAMGLVPGDGSREQGSSNAQFFNVSAVQILKALIHAAALRRLGVRKVTEWAMTQNADSAVSILMVHGRGTDTWSAFLEGLKSGAPVTVSGQWATVQAALAPLQQPEVLRLLEEPDFDVDGFLTSRSTLYVVDPKGEGRVSPTAYVIAAYLDWIKQRAYQLALGRRNVRHHPILLLAPDELAQVAPLRSLPGILAQGPGRGVVVSWATQSFGQLAERYGDDGARAILSSTHSLLLFGGLDGDVRNLEEVSRTLGEVEKVQEHRDGTTSSDRRPLLSVADLVAQRNGRAYLVRAGKAVPLRLPPLPVMMRYRLLRQRPHGGVERPRRHWPGLLAALRRPALPGPVGRDAETDAETPPA